LNNVLDVRTRGQRASDAVALFAGSWACIIGLTLLTLVWVGLNTVWLVFGKFDEYPFILLNLFLTVFSTFQSPLIMMSQNRQAEREKQAELAQAQRDRDMVEKILTKIEALEEK
jgi:uncharacterized membrane protein